MERNERLSAVPEIEEKPVEQSIGTSLGISDKICHDMLIREMDFPFRNC